MSKQKKQKKQENTVDSVVQVFSLARDVEVNNPYHLDGDIDMYNQQNQKLRKQLSEDPDILKQIEEIIKVYEFDSENKLHEQNYKRVQRQIALILRPNIEEDELQFVIGQDWQYDQKEGYVLKQDMTAKIFELVDIWSIGVSKQEYISFIRLLKKKLTNALKIKK